MQAEGLKLNERLLIETVEWPGFKYKKAHMVALHVIFKL